MGGVHTPYGARWSEGGLRWGVKGRGEGAYPLRGSGVDGGMGYCP